MKDHPVETRIPSVTNLELVDRINEETDGQETPVASEALKELGEIACGPDRMDRELSFRVTP